MRWRYLILGMFFAMPTALAIHGFPQRPAYRIPNLGRRYFADDAANRELFFIRFDTQTGNNLILERWDADTGNLKSTTTLKWDDITKQYELPDPRCSTHECMITADGSTICLQLSGRPIANLDYLAI